VAKARTRSVGFGRLAEYDPEGYWQWQCEGRWWRWWSACGINLFIKLDGEWRAAVRCRTVADAGMFSEGFAAGVLSALRKRHAQKTGPVDQPQAE
jgi:hypothetical protein